MTVGLLSFGAPPSLNNPSFVSVGDSLTAFANTSVNITGNTLSRDASGLITVAKTAHGLAGQPKVWLANTTDTSYERFGQINANTDANNFFLQTSDTGLAGSTTGAANSVALIQNQPTQRGAWLWYNSFLKGGGRYLGNFGQGGLAAGSMGVAMTQALLLNPDIVIVAAGINDVYAFSESVATATAAITALVDQVTAAGKRALVLAITPTSQSYTFWTLAKNQNALDTNTNMAAYCAASPSNRLFVDINTPLYDSTNHCAFSWVTFDTLHWTTRAATLIGQTIFNATASWFTWPTNLLPSASGDTGTVSGWQKFNNLGPWVNTAGGAVGTGMSPAASAPVGANWFRSLGTGAGVCSIVTPGDGIGFWAQCVYTPAGTNEAIQYYPLGNGTHTLAALGLSVGDTVGLACELNVSGAQGANYDGFNLQVQKNGGNVLCACGVSNLESVGSTNSPDSFDVNLFAGPALITSDVTALQFILQENFSASGTGCITQIRRMALYKVP